MGEVPARLLPGAVPTSGDAAWTQVLCDGRLGTYGGSITPTI